MTVDDQIDDDNGAAWHHYDETQRRRQDMDLSKYAESESKYLKATDLKGHEVHVKISGVDEASFDDGGKKLILKFIGKEKGMVLNQTNTKRLGGKFGYQSEDWNGKEIVLYAEEVEYQGKLVQGLRVRVPQPAAAPDDEIPF